MSAVLRSLDPPDAGRLARLIAKLKGTPALVWGDFVVDEYGRCRSSRVSREAPVLATAPGTTAATRFPTSSVRRSPRSR